MKWVKNVSKFFMQKRRIFDFFSNIFVGWLFSASGLTVLGFIGAAIMIVATYATESLAAYSPLSYVLSAAAGFIIILILLKLIFNLRGGTYTKKPTFVEYKMVKGRINLVRKSNIYGEPTFILGLTMVEDGQNIKNNNERNKRRLAQKGVINIKEGDLKTATITAVFDKPISNSDFHVHLVQIHGNCPIRESSTINNRTAAIDLSKIESECAFQVWFNEQK